jgi:hypothetical protein
MRRRINRKRKLKRLFRVKNDDDVPDIVTILLATGAIVGAAGTTFGAVAAHQNAQYQADLASRNASIADNDAAIARQQATYNEQMTRRKNLMLMGQQEAAIGASGVAFSGTPLDLLEETVKFGEMEALIERFGGEYKAQSLSIGAESNRMQSQALKTSGRTALTSGAITAVGQGLTASTGYMNQKSLLRS